MKIIPAIDLMEGEVVRLYKGDPDKKTVYSDNPLEIAKKWESAGADMIHLVDLDATLGSGSNFEALRSIAKSVNIPVQVAGGLRNEKIIESALEFAQRVVIGTLAFNDKRAKETASLGFQVLIHTGIMVQVGKHLFGRTRPGATGGVDHWSGISGFFKRYNEGFTHYDSFPSGHTITVWGMATVIAEEYKEKPLIPIISYTLATAAGLSRVTEDAHWLSDVFVGAVLGWTIGKFIVRRRGRKWQVTPFASTNSIGINLIYSGF